MPSLGVIGTRLRRTALLCGVLAASAGTAVRADAQQTARAPAGASDLLYVCNQDDASVAVIDMDTREVLRTVDLTALGFSPNAKPHHVAVEPDGSFWYVTLIGENAVLKFDREDRLVGQVAFETPGMLALHPAEDLLFVGRSMTAVNPPPSIGVIRRSDMALEEIDVVFPRPHAMALQPETGVVYTASLAVNRMAAVDYETGEVELLSLEGPQHALMQFAISPDGTSMVGSGELSHQVLVFDLADPMRPRLLASIDVGPQPFDPVFTPDGRYVWLGNKAADAITVIDVARREVVAVIEGAGIAEPHAPVVSPDGRYVFVSNNNTGADAHAMHADGDNDADARDRAAGTVVVIDARTRAIAEVIPVGHNATGMATRTPR